MFFNDFDDFDSSFNKTKNTIFAAFIINALIIITVLTLIVCGCVWGCRSIQQKGLKGTLNGIWEGPTNNVEQANNT